MTQWLGTSAVVLFENVPDSPCACRQWTRRTDPLCEHHGVCGYGRGAHIIVGVALQNSPVTLVPWLRVVLKRTHFQIRAMSRSMIVAVRVAAQRTTSGGSQRLCALLCEEDKQHQGGHEEGGQH